MNETLSETALLRWSAPQCPFPIEYSARVLDDIRLAVVDAFFSLPRGGAEIGGILLGRRENGRLLITEYAALDCEHATGPSFTLSANDEARLSELLASAAPGFPGLQPVGWYHSHTRSEIFLSPTDLELHNRYFPEPWQVALVMKPHTFKPARAGMFFREADGSIHASAAYQEISVEAIPMHPVAGGTAAEMPRPATEMPRSTAVKGERNPATAMAVPRPEPVADKPEAPAEVLPDLPAPQFLTTPPRSRLWVVGLWVCGLLALAAGGYQTRGVWLSKVMAAVAQARGPAPPVSSGLNTLDRDGQLQIKWDRNSPAVHQALDAILEISDGSSLPQTIALDQAHLLNGFFTYARQSERVDVKLILHQPEGQQVREVTTFLGKLPAPKAPEEDPEVRKERDQLKSELEGQAVLTRKLEKDLKSMRDEMRSQQKRRLTNQLPEGKQ